jgi:ribonuclease P protein component
MLPSAYRLPLKIELKRLRQKGQIFQGKFFGLLLTSQKDLQNFTRFGMIVSNKIAKKAVTRNKIRRLLTESLSIFSPKIKKGHDGVFLAKKAASQADYPQIKKDVELLLKKTKLLP